MGLKDFQIISKLGEGSFSSVWKVKRISDGQEYAMKKVKMMALSEKEKQNALNEVRILASINNPYIIGYKEAFFEDNSGLLCIVMEHAAGGDVYNKITQHQKSRTYFKEDEIWTYAIQMIIGLKTLHDMRILHRDLKSANIFLSKDNKVVKLGDLNVSKVAKANLVYTQTGTPYYASPEVWRDQPYDSKSDIWSLGCVLYEMAALKPPFRANDMQGLNRKIQKGVFDKLPPQYSGDLTSLISMCLQVSPSLRPNCDKLLGHPLILKYGKDLIENVEELDEENHLLGTIVLPRNIKALAAKLPKANYQDARSEELEKGISRSDEKEKERNVESRRGQRAQSQQGPKIEESKNLVKPPSRQYRINSVQRPGVENQVPVRKVEDGEKLRPVSDRRLLVENRVGKENVPENVVQSERQRMLERAREQRDLIQNRGNAEQDYLVNRYLNVDQNQINNKYGNRRVYERDDAMSKRAGDIVRKYYADAENVQRREQPVVREPLAEIRPANGIPPSAQPRDAIDILERYNNAYNVKGRDIYQRPEHVVNVNQNNNYRNRESNIYQGVRQQQQVRNYIRPSWWG